MQRRSFITLLGGAAAAWPLAARAQQRGTPVVGWLSSRTAATDALVLPAFHRALNAQGFFEGRNVYQTLRLVARGVILERRDQTFERLAVEEEVFADAHERAGVNE